MAQDLPVDPDTLRERVRSKYREVALDPGASFHFHTGRGLASRLGYEAGEVDKLPDRAVESFAGAIPVEGTWADVVISNGVINLCADKQAVFAEIFRVLRPGGEPAAPPSRAPGVNRRVGGTHITPAPGGAGIRPRNSPRACLNPWPDGGSSDRTSDLVVAGVPEHELEDAPERRYSTRT